jgi:hypothetical protein
MDPSVFLDFDVDLKKADQCKDQVKSPELVDVATALFRSVESAVGLLFVPYGLMRLGGQFGEWARIHIKARLRLQKLNYKLESDNDPRLGEMEREIATELEKDPAWKEQRDGTIREELKRLLGIESFLNSARALVGATLVGAWTAMETVSKDSWIASLNTRPSQLGYRALSNIESTEAETGLTKKHIPVTLAAKYGFDLRDCLGTILCKKFDFTSLSGIREAYIAAFD